MKLGEFLRSQRVAKGIDLEKAAEDTRIKEVYLRAIEDENYDLIPGEVYQRHYFKTYLEYLELENLYYRLTREKPKPAPVVDKMVRSPAEDIWDTARYLRIAGRLLIPVLVIILLIWFAGFAFSKKDGDKLKGSPDDGLDVELNIPLSGIGPQDDLEKKIQDTLGGVEDLGDVAGEIAGSMDQHHLRIDVSGECWLWVKGPDGVIYQGMLQQGDSKEFGPEKFFIVTIGNTKVAWVYFNNVLIYGGDKGEPKFQTFTLPADLSFDKMKFNVPMEQVVGNQSS